MERGMLQMDTLSKLNQREDMVPTETVPEPEKLVRMNQNPAGEKSETWLKQLRANNRSLIPAKRRSVKRMIFDSIVHCTKNLFFPQVKQPTNMDKFNYDLTNALFLGLPYRAMLLSNVYGLLQSAASK
ncbi:hypothetical protein O6P43_019806 [Quillaja saponaria]|uniref:Uncharacterized protein n=1 Tax=Quillaja saponaria TaxID=32244 RepID=A0AAD7LJA3_QUISA|nr:hypothetical protein O6P43_019806 [Quillaja saponaria]